jgi:hypothetical protein
VAGAKGVGRLVEQYGLTLVLLAYVITAFAAVDGIEMIAAAVDTKAFRGRSEHERIYLTGGRWDVAKGKWTLSGAPSRPYFLPLGVIMDRCHRTRHRVDLFHDQQNVYAKHAVRLHAEMKLHRISIREGIGTLTFGSKREFVPLQAADLAAHLTFKRIVHGPQSLEDTDLGLTARAFQKRFGTGVISVFDQAGLERHLQLVLPRAIRCGLMPS